MPSRAIALWPQRWDAWDAEPADDVIRIACTLAGSGGVPAYPPEHVDVFEDARAITIVVYTRRGASKLAAIDVQLAISLRAPVGRRRVFDGIDGERRPRLTLGPSSSEEGAHRLEALKRAPMWDGCTRRGCWPAD